MIWSFVEIEPQRVGLALLNRNIEEDIMEHGNQLSDPKVAFRTEMPALLHTCYESRVETLKTYPLAFGAQLDRPIHFNFRKDALHFTSHAALKSFIVGTPGFGVSPKHMDSVRHLALYVDKGMMAIDVIRDVIDICKHFGRLEHLQLVYCPTDWGVRTHNPFLQTIVRPEKNEPFWQVLKKWVILPIEGRRGRLEDWKPPVLDVRDPAQLVASLSQNVTGDPMEWSYNVVMPSFGFTPLYGTTDLGSGDLGSGTPAAGGPPRMCWVERSMPRRHRVG